MTKEGSIRMIKVNENFLRLQDNYLFSSIAKKVEEYKKMHPGKEVIRMGIGDVTRPIPEVIVQALKQAAEEMGKKETFRGYGPEQGYEFLREKIVENDYHKRGIELSIDEVFISDGAKCDTGNMGDLFHKDNIVAITDPVYPVYLDTNVIAGRSGEYDCEMGKYNNIVYLKSCEENGFMPTPKELTKDADMIYLCSPNNPTGIAMTKDILEEWLKYAKKNHAILLYDAAYEAYIQEEQIPHSIYEIEGAKEVAIEFKSFSKTAGFTGLRCAYTIVPKEIKINGILLQELWSRRISTKFNGVSYVIQRGAEAVYSEEGKKQIQENIAYYQENATLIRKGLKTSGFNVYGGINAPYIWLKTPNCMKSWDFFDKLLQEVQVVGTPGVGFGPNGEGYFRLTAFGDRKDIDKAIEAIKSLE